MGADKTTTSNTSQATATPQEQTLMQQNIDYNNFLRPIAEQTTTNLYNNINSILTGQNPQARGIGGVDASQTQDMVNAGLRDIMPQFQSSGIMDSGMAAQMALRSSTDIRNQNAQFNVSAAQNLFNLASGGQSNLQSQYQGSTNSLVGELSGLRAYTSNSTTKSMNPFLRSFETSMGQGLGQGISQGVTQAMGGGAQNLMKFFQPGK